MLRGHNLSELLFYAANRKGPLTGEWSREDGTVGASPAESYGLGDSLKHCVDTQHGASLELRVRRLVTHCVDTQHGTSSQGSLGALTTYVGLLISLTRQIFYPRVA